MSSIINEQRLIKTRQEIKYLQEAVEITEKVLSGEKAAYHTALPEKDSFKMEISYLSIFV